MAIVIEGMNFSGFPGFDRRNLEKLTYQGRVTWLRYRIDLTFVEPFEMMLEKEHEAYVWLCLTNLLCSAVEALASLEMSGNGMERFVGFIHKYFRKEWRASRLRLDDPVPGKHAAIRPAEHLYKFFRCGLAHSFCIEWGGILHREDGAPRYLYKYRARNMPRCYALGVVPRELAQDILSAIDSFFAELRTAENHRRRRKRFDERFENVFLQKDHRPIP